MNKILLKESRKGIPTQIH